MARRVEETADPICGIVHCESDGVKKERGTWYCMEHISQEARY